MNIYNQHTPFVGVFDEQTGQQGLGVCRQSARKLYVLHEDELKKLLVVLVVERQSAAHHLVRHNTQTPPIHSSTIVVVLQHLRTEDKQRCTISLMGNLFNWTSGFILHFCIYFIGQYGLPKVVGEETDEQVKAGKDSQYAIMLKG